MGLWTCVCDLGSFEHHHGGWALSPNCWCRNNIMYGKYKKSTVWNRFLRHQFRGSGTESVEYMNAAAEKNRLFMNVFWNFSTQGFRTHELFMGSEKISLSFWKHLDTNSIIGYTGHMESDAAVCVPWHLLWRTCSTNTHTPTHTHLAVPGDRWRGRIDTDSKERLILD